ncbi:MAG: hypothetical protein JHC76_10070 [Akkermansiaceae bacterium]|jgi:hypothetical protein|nr:hypothetical protein [Akkermansiaceae bacterium]MBJ7396379.1 hypothetical protein [Akkermansiaceae bacterium]MBJ7396381.1 hypothetical protein [Akkermansiaceae bacterium]
MQRLIRVFYLCENLKVRIQSAWEKLPVPDTDSVCELEKSVILREPKEINEWINGKCFDKISCANNFEYQMPFYYLTNVAASYYLGGYMLQSCQNLSEGYEQLENSFGFDHLLDFISSSRAASVLMLLDYDCRIVLLAFIEMILIISDEIKLDQNRVGIMYAFLNAHNGFA